MGEVVFEQVTCRYPGAGRPAICGLDLQVPEGERFVLCGAAESGKSTVLRMVAGLVPPTEGRILVSGRPVGEGAEPQVSMVFQNYSLYPNLTVSENIALPLRRRRVDGRSVKAQVREAAAQLELDDLLSTSAANLSAGQRIRVAFARGLVSQPEVLLMDEPLANLEHDIRHDITDMLAAAQRQHGITTILATSDPDEALTLGDRVGVLEAGVLREVVLPDELSEPVAGQRAATSA